MAKHAQRITWVFGSALVSSVAWSGGAPVDEDLLSGPSEAPITTYISECSPIAVAGLRYCQEELLDLNNDGDADLFMGIGISSPARNKYYQGRGSGLFASAVFTGPQAGTSTADIKFADLDGDGDLDMVEANRNGVNYIYTNTNPGNGAASFSAPVQIDSRTDRTSSVAVGDVDNDGDLDIVFSNEGTGTGGANTQSNLVYLNGTSSANNITFGAAIVLDAPGSTGFTRRVALLDAEGDGDLDIIATNATQQTDGTGTGNLIYVNQVIGSGGPGDFDAGVDLTTGTDDDNDEANSIAIGDINGDSIPDLVFSVWQGPNRYYINNSSPGGGLDFETTGVFGNADQTSHVRLGDLDDDGDLDAVVTTFEGNNLIHLNTIGSGSPGFAAGLELEDPSDDPSGGTGFDRSRHLGLTDLNNDGYPDIIVANRDQLDLRFLNNATCSGGGDACHPFQNQGQTINAQLTSPIVIPPNLPYDLRDALEELDVDDADNVYPADHSVRILPAGGPNWSCETPGSSECGSTVIVPDTDYLGALTVNMRTTDGFNTSQSWPLAIMVSSVGGSPEFVTDTPPTNASESIEYVYDIQASDPDNDPIEFDTPPGFPLPVWLDLNDNGNRTARLSGTPSVDDLGDHEVRIRIRDGNGNQALQIFTITVSAGAPTFTSTPITAATEGSVYTYSIEASDPNGDALTIAYDAVSDMPAWLSLTDNTDGTATLTGTPAGTDIGTYDITLIVTDTTPLSVTQAFTITVASAADAPTITLTGDNPLVLTQGDAFVEPGFSADDAQDGDITADVVVTGTVDTATVGTYTLTYTVTDSAGNQAQVTREVEVQVAGGGGGGGTTNADPVLTSPGAQTARVGQAFSLNLASRATDADGDTLTFSATGLPSSLSLSSSGTLSGTPVAVDATNSPYTVNVTVDDGNGGTDSATFTLTVNPAVSGGGGSSGGGGAFGLLELLMLLGGAAVAGLRRRLGFGRA